MKLNPKLVLGVLTSIGLYLFNFNPSMIEGKDLYLIEYLTANFKYTIFLTITFFLVLLLVTFTESYKKIETKIKEIAFGHYSFFHYFKNNILFAILILGFIFVILFQGGVLFKNLYNFWNDSFAFSFRRSIYTKAAVDHLVGDLFKAKDRLLKFKESYKGSYTADTYAKERIDNIQTLIDIKEAFIAHADNNKKTYGLTIFSFHKYADALRLNPWDFELRNKVIKFIDEYNTSILPSLIKAKEGSAKQAKINMQDTCRSLVALGFVKQSDFLRPESKESDLMNQLSSVLGVYSEAGLMAISRKIWMIDDIQKLVDHSEPENLRMHRDLLMSKITNKENRIKYREDDSSLLNQIQIYNDYQEDNGSSLREEPSFEKQESTDP